MKREPRFRVKLFAAEMLLMAPVAPNALAVDVLMQHNHPSNDGQNLHETVLTPDNVSTKSGKLFSTPLDGGVRGQPLVKTGVIVTTGPHQGTQDVVFVTTQMDSVYAINAGDGSILWGPISLPTKYHGPGDTVVAPGSNNNRSTKQAMEDTPAIDPAANVLYVECVETGKGSGIRKEGKRRANRSQRAS